ncbi:SMP-30/gluconolactonase/LRE family protein, partial [Rhizobium ruizarguesonis]
DEFAAFTNPAAVVIGYVGELLDEVKLDRGAFACMLGGPDRTNLYITAARWFGMDKMDQMGGNGQLLSVEVETAGAG